jgi:hypothetical protein
MVSESPAVFQVPSPRLDALKAEIALDAAIRRFRLMNDNGSKARPARFLFTKVFLFKEVLLFAEVFLFTEAWRGRTARVTRLSPAQSTSHLRLRPEDSLRHPHAAI